jgi:hypothetical protein
MPRSSATILLLGVTLFASQPCCSECFALVPGGLLASRSPSEQDDLHCWVATAFSLRGSKVAMRAKRSRPHSNEPLVRTPEVRSRLSGPRRSVPARRKNERGSGSDKTQYTVEVSQHVLSHHSQNKRQMQFWKNDGLIYMKNVLPPNDFVQVQVCVHASSLPGLRGLCAPLCSRAPCPAT